VWQLIGAVVCLLAAQRVRLFADAGNGWPHNALPLDSVSQTSSWWEKGLMPPAKNLTLLLAIQASFFSYSGPQRAGSHCPAYC